MYQSFNNFANKNYTITSSIKVSTTFWPRYSSKVGPMHEILIQNNAPSIVNISTYDVISKKPHKLATNVNAGKSAEIPFDSCVAGIKITDSQRNIWSGVVPVNSRLDVALIDNKIVVNNYESIIPPENGNIFSVFNKFNVTILLLITAAILLLYFRK